MNRHTSSTVIQDERLYRAGVYYDSGEHGALIALESECTVFRVQDRKLQTCSIKPAEITPRSHNEGMPAANAGSD
jgi:hypothetical protein